MEYQDNEYLQAVATIREALEASESAFKAQYPRIYAQLTNSDKYLIGKAMGARMKDAGYVGADDAKKAVDDFEQYGEAFGVRGKLSFQMHARQAAAVDPATTLPHEDIPQLKTIRNLTDVIRVKNLPKEKLMSFANLRPGSPSFKEFNERIAYIVDHRIGDGAPPTIVEKKSVTSTKSAAAARALVDALRPSDIGSTNSSAGGGRWEQLSKAQTKLHRIIDQLVAQRVPEPKIIQTIREEIETLSSSSIRG